MILLVHVIIGLLNEHKRDNMFNYWRPHFHLDTDRDGVLDYRDCQPFNRHRQDISIENLKRFIQHDFNKSPWRDYIKKYFVLAKNTKQDGPFLRLLLKTVYDKNDYFKKFIEQHLEDLVFYFIRLYREQYPVPTQKDKQNIKLINDEISKRNYYGMCEEYAHEPGIILNWSNGAASWFPFNDVRKGEFLEIDANEIYVPLPRKQVQRILHHLNPLPLYALSFEAKQRGIAPKNVTEIWALLQKERINREKGI